MPLIKSFIHAPSVALIVEIREVTLPDFYYLLIEYSFGSWKLILSAWFL
jgi:hypothetical protein